MNNPVYIIAEAGVNHNGSAKIAFQLIDVAVMAGADAVKFQTFKAGSLVTNCATKANYQKVATDSNESQFSMLKKLELTYETFKELMAYCKKQKIEFLSTAFDLGSLDFLVNKLDLKILKIASGEITNGPLLLAHAQTGCDLIISTGMSTSDEVKEALGVVAFGLKYGADLLVKPSREMFQQAYNSSIGQQLLFKKVTVLHCTTEYPAPLADINLKAIQTMKSDFGLKTGYSDHSEGITVSIAATAMGATLIEKHFTLDRTLPGPDHKASLEPDELKAMVKAIRTVEQSMGDGLKKPRQSELKNIPIARKSLIAISDIKKGDVFTASNITAKRPGSGKSPMEFWNIIGSKAERDFLADEIIG